MARFELPIQELSALMIAVAYFQALINCLYWIHLEVIELPS